jgi:hypothetical protein
VILLDEAPTLIPVNVDRLLRQAEEPGSGVCQPRRTARETGARRDSVEPGLLRDISKVHGPVRRAA